MLRKQHNGRDRRMSGSEHDLAFGNAVLPYRRAF
jgi:hypothetical protein